MSNVRMLMLAFSCFLCVVCVNAQQSDGLASYYGKKFHGKKAANGSRYNMYAMTCAHKTLPFGTKVKVTNMNNGQEAVVTVTDRGPYVEGRVVDLSHAAAKKIGMIRSGVVPVSIEIMSIPEYVMAELTKIEPKKVHYKLPTKVITKMDLKVIDPSLLFDHLISLPTDA